MIIQNTEQLICLIVTVLLGAVLIYSAIFNTEIFSEVFGVFGVNLGLSYKWLFPTDKEE